MPPSPILTIWRLGPDLLESFQQLPASALDAPRSILSPEEQHRAAAFHLEEHRRVYIAAHAALRIVLGRLAAAPPHSIAIVSQNGSKPALAPNPTDLRFNLSHTHNAVLIAVTTSREVGIDVEWHRPIDDLEAMAQAVMSPRELVAWKQLAPAPRTHAFYHLWTRKEAYLKAIGLGLFRDLHAITVPAAPGFLPRPVPVRDCNEAATPLWHLCDLAVWPGYSAAIAWQGSQHPALATHDLALADLTGEPHP